MPPSRFRPCVDLHDGVVKQIVGGTLSDDSPSTLKTNFVAAFVRSLVQLRRNCLISGKTENHLLSSPSCIGNITFEEDMS